MIHVIIALSVTHCVLAAYVCYSLCVQGPKKCTPSFLAGGPLRGHPCAHLGGGYYLWQG